MSKKRQIILHHTAIKQSEFGRQFDIINAVHKRRWNFRSSLGYYGGYHYFIEKSGELKRYRVESERAAHCVVPGFDYNNTSIGICLAGNLVLEKPTREQIETMTSLVLDVQRRYGIPSTKVYHHWDLKATQCPGVDLRALIEEQQIKDLKSRLGRAQAYLPRAKGARKRRVQRLIRRILSIIGV